MRSFESRLPAVSLGLVMNAVIGVHRLRPVRVVHLMAGKSETAVMCSLVITRVRK